MNREQRKFKKVVRSRARRSAHISNSQKRRVSEMRKNKAVRAMSNIFIQAKESAEEKKKQTAPYEKVVIEEKEIINKNQ